MATQLRTVGKGRLIIDQCEATLFVSSLEKTGTLKRKAWFVNDKLPAIEHVRSGESQVKVCRELTNFKIARLKSWDHIPRFKSGNFRIGSDDSIFLTSLNALSCSESHSTLFGALFLVNSVKEAITSAQFGMY